MTNARASSALFLALLLSPGLATPVPAQQRGTDTRQSHLSIFGPKEKDGQILSYRYLGASTDVVMRGPSLAPQARIKLRWEVGRDLSRSILIEGRLPGS